MASYFLAGCFSQCALSCSKLYIFLAPGTGALERTFGDNLHYWDSLGFWQHNLHPIQKLQLFQRMIKPNGRGVGIWSVAKILRNRSFSRAPLDRRLKKHLVFTFADCARARPCVPHTHCALNAHRDSVPNSFVPGGSLIVQCSYLSLASAHWAAARLHAREYKVELGTFSIDCWASADILPIYF